MSIYDIDTLISQARKLAADYLETMGKPLPGMSGEIALNDAARILNLELCEDTNVGYDAIGTGESAGKKVQIKGRLVLDEDKSSQRIGQVSIDQTWDSVILVLLNRDYEPFALYEAERNTIIENAAQSSDGKKKRGAMSIARFKKIARLVWSNQTLTTHNSVVHAD